MIDTNDKPRVPATSPHHPTDPAQPQPEPIPLPPDTNPQPAAPVREPDEPAAPISDPLPSELTRLSPRDRNQLTQPVIGN